MAKDGNPKILKPMLFSIGAILGVFAITIGGYFVYGKLKPKSSPPVVDVWLFSVDKVAVEQRNNIVDRSEMPEKLKSIKTKWAESNPGQNLPLEIALHYEEDIYYFFFIDNLISQVDMNPGQETICFLPDHPGNPKYAISRIVKTSEYFNIFLFKPFYEDNRPGENTITQVSEKSKPFIYLAVRQIGVDGEMHISISDGGTTEFFNLPGENPDYGKLASKIRAEMGKYSRTSGSASAPSMGLIIDKGVYLKNIFKLINTFRNMGIKSFILEFAARIR